MLKKIAISQENSAISLDAIRGINDFIDHGVQPDCMDKVCSLAASSQL